MRDLARRLIRRQEAERLWVARELHDVLGQSFTLLKLILDGAKHADSAGLAGIIEDALAVVDEATDKVRRVSRGLRPGMLDLSLKQALEWLFAVIEKEPGVKVIFRARGLEDNLPQELNTAVYRIVQEALENIDRHAGVKTAYVNISVTKKGLSLRIKDEGMGFDAAQLAAGHRGGLVFMKERAAMLGGNLEIESKPGAGTVITALFPVPANPTDA